MKPSKNASRALVLYLLLALSALPVRLRSDDLLLALPDMGSASDNLFTPAKEKQLGKAFMRYIRTTQKVIDDPLMDDYINQLGHSLAAHTSGKNMDFHFFLVESPQINAYAGPGGYIGIYTGLVLTTQSEAELAAVIAHEITHVTQKHLLRAWHASSHLNLAQGAALIAAIVLGAAAGGDAAIAATLGAQAALQQQQINFTRHNEQEADRLGIQTLYESRFDPRAMPTFFARMGRANRSYGQQLPEFLRTHPVTNARIADALGRAEKYPYLQSTDSLRYLLLRARLRERGFFNPKDAIEHFRKALNEGRYRHEAAARYGLALALLRNHQPQAARKQIQRLLEQYPHTPEFIVLSARIDLDIQQPQQALKTLESAIQQAPLSYPLHITLAELYLRTGHPDLALKRLKKLAKLRPENTRVYKLLAQAAAQTGEQVESHEYMATHYYLMGDLEAALLQLKIARKQPGLDFYHLARLESRIKEIQQEKDALKAENH